MMTAWSPQSSPVWILSSFLMVCLVAQTANAQSSSAQSPSAAQPCLSVAHPSTPPQKLLNNEFGFAGGVKIEWTAPELVITTSEMGKTSTRRGRVSKAAWTKFWATAERLGVWCWQPEYTSARSLQTDGTYWTLELAHAGQRVKSEGYNAVPGNYAAFKTALLELLPVKP
jgi:hypothetical protein